MLLHLDKDGIRVEDKKKVLELFERVNFYKINQYLNFFKGKNINFEEVYNLYIFDKKLRNLIQFYIGDIEIELKNKISHYLGDLQENDFQYFSRNSKEIYEDNKKANDLIDKIINRCGQEEERKLKVYYGEGHKKEKGIPIWMAFESLTLGETLEFLNALTLYHKNAIKSLFPYRNYNIFYENLESIRIVRNICAHYGRLWNNNFYSPRKKIKGYNEIWEFINTKKMVSYIYGVFSIILPKEDFKNFNKEFSYIIDRYQIDISMMGFTKNLIIESEEKK